MPQQLTIACRDPGRYAKRTLPAGAAPVAERDQLTDVVIPSPFRCRATRGRNRGPIAWSRWRDSSQLRRFGHHPEGHVVNFGWPCCLVDARKWSASMVEACATASFASVSSIRARYRSIAPGVAACRSSSGS
jgi:hypothetical protein